MALSNISIELLVLDASGILNLLAVDTSLARRILLAHECQVAVSDVVLDKEVLRYPRDGGLPVQEYVERLMSDGLILRHPIDARTIDRYVELAGPLGDGESATIAIAGFSGGTACLDDQRAINVGREGGVRTCPTIEVIAHQRVLHAVGKEDLAIAVFDALRFGRMRVPNEYLDLVLELLGPERASACPSLPRRVLASSV